MKWKTLASKYVFKGNRVKIRRDKCKVNGKTIDFDVVELPDWVAVLAFANGGKIVLSKQYRYALKKELIQLPAGFIDEGETPLQAAKREFQEETGMKLIKVKKLATWATISGKGPTKVTVFFGTAGKGSGQKLEHTEKGMQILYKSPKEVLTMIKAGKIWSALHVAAILAAKEKYQKLFK